jgi:hypothetical protein
MPRVPKNLNERKVWAQETGVMKLYLKWERADSVLTLRKYEFDLLKECLEDLYRKESRELREAFYGVAFHRLNKAKHVRWIAWRALLNAVDMQSGSSKKSKTHTHTHQ